jgi:hypothetical protein
MSNRNADKPRLIFGVRQWEIEGTFQALGGAGTVVASAVKGFGFGYAPVNGVMALRTESVVSGVTSTPGIVRTGVGLYTITLEDPYIDYVTAMAWLMGPGPNANDAQFQQTVSNLNTLNTAPTFTLVTSTTGGAAVDLGTTYNIGFRFVFRDSTRQFNKP